MVRSLALGAALSAALLSTSAFAADLPMEAAPAVIAVPSFSWTGAYLGVQAGYGKDRLGGGAFRPKGALIGGYAGYNYQFDASPLVVGVETDFNWSDQDDKVSFAPFGSVKADVKWAGATRGRVGVAFDRVMVYGAAGVAYARVKGTGTGGAATQSRSFTGWTAGGGAEYAFTDNVVGRAEYRYADYGRRSGVKLTENRVMGGLAYKF
ncbi:outer membrane protein [Chenggangzhangella methanolivorans]|uniref:Porin family protein n=1 Tax=Chenggangzhangella methanolivorans TaxID=1437009 RepID=A0A9E6UMI0_9HYPH|nr:outer membrane protein [Chenggangzhangella methanolivorans]QZO00046.1 porin family protein [Chenggangzhangella methanolivorans]